LFSYRKKDKNAEARTTELGIPRQPNHKLMRKETARGRLKLEQV